MFGTLRYVLASLVVVTHLGPLPLKYIGYYAVFCFFTLSGYILSAAYERHYLHSAQGYARYYLNRLLRVAPAYAVALLLAIVVVHAYPDEASAVHPQCVFPETGSDWLTNISIVNVSTLTGFPLRSV